MTAAGASSAMAGSQSSSITGDGAGPHPAKTPINVTRETARAQRCGDCTEGRYNINLRSRAHMGVGRPRGTGGTLADMRDPRDLRRGAWWRVAASAVLVVGACGPAPQPSPSPGAEASPSAAAIVCVDRAFRAALHVDGGSDRPVRATHYDTGREVDVRARPPGVFIIDPDRPTILLDASGHVVSFDGEITKSACVDEGTQTIYIWRGDVPDPNRPPN